MPRSPVETQAGVAKALDATLGQAEDQSVPAAWPAVKGSGVMRDVLVVANQTLAASGLRETLQEIRQSGSVRVWVVVPATPVTDQHVQVELGLNERVRADMQAAYPAEERSEKPDAYQVAEGRLEHALRMLGELGMPAEGQVGDANPLHAVEEFLGDHTVDEVVVSTLPRHLSHWLRADLPSRIQRRFSLPVTTVTAGVPEPTGA
jgi:hypothetical protein